MRRIFLTANLLIAGLLPGFAAAQELSPADLFSVLDRNQDGKLEMSEIPEGQFRFFERVVRMGDQNQDGTITLEELTIALKAAPDSAQQPATKEADPVDTPREKPGQNRDLKLEVFHRLDQNKDGKLTRDEIPERAQSFFNPVFEALGTETLTPEQLRDYQRPQMTAETDRPLKDGELMSGPSQSPVESGERQPFRPHPLLIQLLDADRNGTLNAEELAKAATVFKQLDRNGDGELDGSELIGIPLPGRNPPPGPADGTGPRGPRRADQEAPDSLGQLFSRMDRNQDNLVSETEAPARLQENFSRLDKNGDGQLDKEELRHGLELLRNARNQ